MINYLISGLYFEKDTNLIFFSQQVSPSLSLIRTYEYLQHLLSLTFEFSDHFHPRCRINFHQGIRYKNYMHTIEHTLEKRNGKLFNVRFRISIVHKLVVGGMHWFPATAVRAVSTQTDSQIGSYIAAI